MSRTSLYSKELAEDICEQLAEGRSLRAICAQEGMPGKSTVMRWIEDIAEFRDQYARARERQAEHYLDEIIAIADDAAQDLAEVEGREVVNHEVIQRSRLRVDTRKWAMSKLAPKKYGDRLDLNHSGDIGLKTMSDADLDRAIAEAAARTGIAIAPSGEGAAAEDPPAV